MRIRFSIDEQKCNNYILTWYLRRRIMLSHKLWRVGNNIISIRNSQVSVLDVCLWYDLFEKLQMENFEYRMYDINFLLYNTKHKYFVKL